MLSKVKKSHESSVRFPVNFEERINKAYGEKASDLRGYLTLQGKRKMIILIDNWHVVDGDLKDSIWINIMEVFIVLKDKILKKKWLGYAGEHCRGFKTYLTHDYIECVSDELEPPYVKYPIIDQSLHTEKNLST
ncbi:hypothetical protein KIW84_061287 [Lathyrus oleraceus]|uniref:Uncharacterized protein n=1 Tax=Pisum sativum TaxID=3888 RepID=A0A9D4W226_PEA|nr:hypothetical protein KIW84_061287 [Pisum sativum]